VKVIEKSTQLLLKVYTSIAYRHEYRISEFEDSYLDKCKHNIEEQLAKIKARTEEPKEEFEKVETKIAPFSFPTTVTQKVLPPEEKKIVRTLYLIKEFIKVSEKDGPMEIPTHASL